jgi:hypothetical protein
MEELLELKSFAELTEDEREFVLHELGSAQEYDALRKISAALVADKADLSPDPRVLRNLKSRMNKGQETWYRQVLTYKVPAYAVVIFFTVAGSALMFVRDDQSVPAADTITKIKTDTLYLAAPSDTIFVDRVIVKYAPAEKNDAPDYSLVKNISPLPNKASQGVNMKEKEELERFLVSGS